MGVRFYVNESYFSAKIYLWFLFKGRLIVQKINNYGWERRRYGSQETLENPKLKDAILDEMMALERNCTWIWSSYQWERRL